MRAGRTAHYTCYINVSFTSLSIVWFRQILQEELCVGPSGHTKKPFLHVTVTEVPFIKPLPGNSTGCMYIMEWLRYGFGLRHLSTPHWQHNAALPDRWTGEAEEFPR